jgi:Holliday junction resolvasome RuvABC endonuclease subunit
MLAYLALDPSASNTGWAVIGDDGEWKPALVECGSFSCAGADIAEHAAKLSTHLTALIRKFRDRGVQIVGAAIEAPILVPRTRSVIGADGQAEERPSADANSMMKGPAIIGAAVAILVQWRIPVVMVAPATWRKSFIGTGRAPVGARAAGKGRAWFKSEVRKKSAHLGLLFNFTVRNYDASDALGIAFHYAGASGSKCAVAAMRRNPA